MEIVTEEQIRKAMEEAGIEIKESSSMFFRRRNKKEIEEQLKEMEE